MRTIEECKKQIRQDAKDGVDFGCKCSYCGLTPIGIVERGDAIPYIYRIDNDSKTDICFRCSENLADGLSGKDLLSPNIIRNNKQVKDWR